MMAQHNHVSHLNVFRKFEDVMRFIVINKIQNQIDHLSSRRFLHRRFGRASMEYGDLQISQQLAYNTAAA